MSWKDRYGEDDGFDRAGCVLPLLLAGAWIAALAAVVWAIVRWS